MNVCALVVHNYSKWLRPDILITDVINGGGEAHVQTYQASSGPAEPTGSLCWRVDVYLQSIHHNLVLSTPPSPPDTLHSHFSTPSSVLNAVGNYGSQPFPNTPRSAVARILSLVK